MSKTYRNPLNYFARIFSKMAVKYRNILIFSLIGVGILFFYEWWLFQQGAHSYVSQYILFFWVTKKLLVFSIVSLVMLTICLIRNLPYKIFRLIVLSQILLSFYSLYYCGKPIKKKIEMGNKTYGEFFHDKRNTDRVLILNPVSPLLLSFSSNSAMRYETPVLGGMNFEPLRRYAKFIGLFNEKFYNFKGEQANDSLFSYLLETTDFINEENIHLLNMANIKYLVVEGFIPKITSLGENSLNPFHLVVDKDIKIYENKDALDHAYIVHNAKIISDEKRILEELKRAQFDYRNSVILEERAWPGEELKNYQSGDAPVYSDEPILAGDEYAKITEYKPESVTVEAKMDKDGFLVLVDSYYPGWKVFIDGRAGHIYKANYLFRAVFLKSGLHRVRFVYQPFSLFVGAVISVISLIILAGICMKSFLSRFRNNKNK